MTEMVRLERLAHFFGKGAGGQIGAAARVGSVVFKNAPNGRKYFLRRA